MSIVQRSHECNHHYELKSYEKAFACDGCKTKGFGRRYQCSVCGHELHEECRFPTTTITHEYFGSSVFRFLERPITRYDKKHRVEYLRFCDACGKDICGISYHCKADNLDLHPGCLHLEKRLAIDDKVFELRTKLSSKCKWCNKKKIDGRKVGWSYVSACKNYHIHVLCMRELLHEACTKAAEMGLEKVGLRQLIKSSGRNGGSGSSTVLKTVKIISNIMLAVVTGDPTTLVSGAVVGLVSRGLRR